MQAIATKIGRLAGRANCLDGAIQTAANGQPDCAVTAHFADPSGQQQTSPTRTARHRERAPCWSLAASRADRRGAQRLRRGRHQHDAHRALLLGHRCSCPALTATGGSDRPRMTRAAGEAKTRRQERISPAHRRQPDRPEGRRAGALGGGPPGRHRTRRRGGAGAGARGARRAHADPARRSHPGTRRRRLLPAIDRHSDAGARPGGGDDRARPGRRSGRALRQGVQRRRHDGQAVLARGAAGGRRARRRIASLRPSAAAVAEALSLSAGPADGALAEARAFAAAEQVLAGDLAVISLSQIFELLAEQQHSGTLRVLNTETNARIEIYFQAGRVDFAAAVGVAEELLIGRFAVETGDVTVGGSRGSRGARAGDRQTPALRRGSRRPRPHLRRGAGAGDGAADQRARLRDAALARRVLPVSTRGRAACGGGGGTAADQRRSDAARGIPPRRRMAGHRARNLRPRRGLRPQRNQDRRPAARHADARRGSSTRSTAGRACARLSASCGWARSTSPRCSSASAARA